MSNAVGGVQEVERKIFFYRVFCGVDAGRRPTAFDYASVLRQIGSLNFAAREPYHLSANGPEVCCRVDGPPEDGKLRIGNVRRRDLPMVDRGTHELSHLRVAREAGLTDQTHVRFFADNIVGAEFNFYGPRIPRLAAYIQAKCPGAPEVGFEQLMKSTAAEELGRLGDIRSLKIAVRPSYAEQVARANENMGAMLRAAQEVGQPEVVEIILKARKHSRMPLGNNRGVLAFVRGMLGLSDLRENVQTFEVRGTDAEADELRKVDILGDRLVVTKKCVKVDDTVRGPQSSSVYAKIQEAYDELRPDLALLASRVTA